MDHYQRLGVSRDATHEQIRDAFRARARRAHPDTGTGSQEAMAALNRAWYVLGDDARRRDYDLQLGASRTPPPRAPANVPPPAPRPIEPLPAARFPWRFLLLVATIAIAVVVIADIVTRPGAPAPIDNLLRPGDCVAIEVNQDAYEVPCDDDAEWEVVQLVPISARCPVGTEAHRDRQGMGTACIRRRGLETRSAPGQDALTGGAAVGDTGLEPMTSTV